MNSKTDAVMKLFAKKVVFKYVQKARPALFFAFFCFAFYTPFRTIKSAFSYSHFIHRPIRTFAFSHFAFYTCPFLECPIVTGHRNGQILGDWEPQDRGLWSWPSHCDISYRPTNRPMLLFIYVQVSRPACCLPLEHWSLHLWTLLSQTLSCLIIFSGLTFWTTDSWLVFAVKKRCMTETTRCWSYYLQKTSASSFWKPYNRLDKNMSSISSKRTEVRNNCSHDITYLSNVAHVHKDKQSVSSLSLWLFNMFVGYWFYRCNFTIVTRLHG